MNKEWGEQIWNAAITHMRESVEESDCSLSIAEHELLTPSKIFDEWWERFVVNPPDGIETWGD